MIESTFQMKLIERLENAFPGAIVLKNDPQYIQGIPDLTMLYEDTWFTFECKRSKNEHRQPNQEWYVNKMNEISSSDCGYHSFFIYPENVEEVISDIQNTLKFR